MEELLEILTQYAEENLVLRCREQAFPLAGISIGLELRRL